jgi:hypothetical protein
VTTKAKAAKVINLIMRFSLQEHFLNDAMVVGPGSIIIDPYQKQTARRLWSWTMLTAGNTQPCQWQTGKSQ